MGLYRSSRAVARSSYDVTMKEKRTDRGGVESLESFLGRDYRVEYRQSGGGALKPMTGKQPCSYIRKESFPVGLSGALFSGLL